MPRSKFLNLATSETAFEKGPIVYRQPQTTYFQLMLAYTILYVKLKTISR